MRLVTMQILQEETGIPMTIISNSFQVQPNKNTLALHDMKVTIKQVFFPKYIRLSFRNDVSFLSSIVENVYESVFALETFKTNPHILIFFGRSNFLIPFFFGVKLIYIFLVNLPLELLKSIEKSPNKTYVNSSKIWLLISYISLG